MIIKTREGPKEVETPRERKAREKREIEMVKRGSIPNTDKEGESRMKQLGVILLILVFGAIAIPILDILFPESRHEIANILWMVLGIIVIWGILLVRSFRG